MEGRHAPADTDPIPTSPAKPCRTCVDFRSWMKSQRTRGEEAARPGDAAKYGCPADSLALGRGTWRLLHTMAAYYPDQPSSQQQQDMRSFITLFSKFYPCPPCAEDFREWLKTNTPKVDSRSGLSQWFCEAHNEVNKKLQKPLFDCKRINERWLDGWADGSCD
ncbi:FAD-linked sulfhydryl oxidase ALR [Portunus trituberculatus]|uniref:Sulfhydryl oxidase n=1 Tax=Portunus trituberculatus TaxID=210409 RepID=A0A5B7F6L8_PORTR|nr:FAD-linked sulfhydryl oxidase ALR [Portunus trituberculatus]